MYSLTEFSRKSYLCCGRYNRALVVYDDPRIKILMQLSLQADTVDVKFIKRATKTKVTLSHISHVFTLLISNVGLQNQTTTVKIELVPQR